ncbi:anhydro-N-acetylmuramic acid kinase [Temperatibacter marinus]|uniref:Anhydro-N-acetylmuramic acid kinase n=1 Tax=Temperatibacter marinus TaxID=1456591 RepID=A0AA52ECF4_9PROT|nr:anhydro-N-acetylmuramic acid kinase [Temperatibacter marinus]WND02221.1 anhydro-N-acetylmuramic acid kinase [Temperatibacter marinus]
MSSLGESGERKTAIGLMSGTSMDGIDAAYIVSDGVSVEKIGPSISIPMPEALQDTIRTVMNRATNATSRNDPIPDLESLSHEITVLHAKAVQTLLTTYDLDPRSIDMIGFHGQTITHKPEKGWTWQIGCGQTLANLTGIPVINDFRSNDMKHGGEGAPLVPVYHAALLKNSKDDEKARAILNLGGVANVTWVKWTGNSVDLLAFDTGPANALSNDWAREHTGQRYDKDGNLAAQGTTHEDVLMGLMASPYFDEHPPKSLDRDDFTISSLRGLNATDGASTLIDFTVEAIVSAQSHFPESVAAWYVCGGGVHNRTMMRRLRKHIPVMIDPVDAMGWNSDSLEAEAFAFLAIRSQRNLPLSFPETTGTSEAVTGGVYYSPLT